MSTIAEPVRSKAPLTALLAALLLAPVAMMATSALASGDDEARIRAATDDWMAAFKDGDLDALMQLYHPGVVVALHDQPALRGINEVRDYFEPRAGVGEIFFELDIERIEVDGDIAHLLSAYWFQVDSPGRGTYSEAGRSLLLYRKNDAGDWLIYLDIDQSTPDVAWPSPSGRSAGEARR